MPKRVSKVLVEVELEGFEEPAPKEPTFLHHRPGNPRDPYERPTSPHHVHLANDCVDPLGCDHWVGGRPEATHPHHVEIDGTTGAVAYTRLTDDEIRDYQKLSEFMVELEAKGVADRDAKVRAVKARAASDPDFRALVELLGFDLTEGETPKRKR